MTEKRSWFMNDWEIRAILAGTKTQARQVVKPQPTDYGLSWVTSCDGEFSAWKDQGLLLDEYSAAGGPSQRTCPYGQPGDRLWVPEKHAVTDLSDGTPVVAYAADKSQIAIGRAAPEGDDRLIQKYVFLDDVHVDRWRSPVSMPRWASRITLEITNVRVERLRDISEEDALSSGCGVLKPYSAHWSERDVAREDFRLRHEATHGPGSWDANPWVWVMDFRRVE